MSRADELIQYMLEMRQKEPRYIYAKKVGRRVPKNDREHFLNSLLQSSRPSHSRHKLGNPVSRSKRLSTVYKHDDAPKYLSHNDDHYHYHRHHDV